MERVLVGMDDSEPSRKALEFALEQYPAATIRVVTVPETDSYTFGLDSSMADEAREDADEVLERAGTIADDYGRTIETERRFGNPAKTIVAIADDLDVDLIVVGSQGKSGIQRVLLGSVAETVVRRAPCPVTVVR